MGHNLLIILTTVVLMSCHPKDKTQIDKFQVLLPDTSKTHRPNIIFDNLKLWGNQMGLPQIDTGVNDIEVRLWTSSRFIPDLLVIIRENDSSIINQKIEYFFSPDGVTHFKKGELLQADTLKPLIDSLKKIDFSKLISQNEIENFNDNLKDGITYHLEFSSLTYYKLLTYHCPEHFAPTEQNNKRFLDIILLLDKYLRFYSLKCS